MPQHQASSWYHTLPVQWIFLGAQVKHAHPYNLGIGQMLESRMLSSTCFTSIRKQHSQDPPPGPRPVTWTGSCLTQRPRHPVWAPALLHRRAVNPNRSPSWRSWTQTAEHHGRCQPPSVRCHHNQGRVACGSIPPMSDIYVLESMLLLKYQHFSNLG